MGLFEGVIMFLVGFFAEKRLTAIVANAFFTWSADNDVPDNQRTCLSRKGDTRRVDVRGDDGTSATQRQIDIPPAINLTTFLHKLGCLRCCKKRLKYEHNFYQALDDVDGDIEN